MDEKLKEVYGELYEDLVRVYPIRTICEVLREIYWGISEPLVREKVVEAMTMAKKMNDKLVEYYELSTGEHRSKLHKELFKENPFCSKINQEKRLNQALKEADENNRNNVRKG